MTPRRKTLWDEWRESGPLRDEFLRTLNDKKPEKPKEGDGVFQGLCVVAFALLVIAFAIVAK